MGIPGEEMIQGIDAEGHHYHRQGEMIGIGMSRLIGGGRTRGIGAMIEGDKRNFPFDLCFIPTNWL